MSGEKSSLANLKLSHEGFVATLTIDHSARRNAMTRSMWQALPSVLKQLPTATRCLIVRGQGDHFCSGGDISEYPSFRFDEESLRCFHEDDVAPALEGLLALDIPVIAQLQGNCIGGGLEIACCADIRIAGQSAVFGAPIAKLGMPMAQRELAIAVRSIGEVTLREMLLEAKLLSADEMKSRSWLTRLVSDTQLSEEVQATAQRIAALSPQAARLNKQFLRQINKLNQPLAPIETAPSAMNSIVNAYSPYAYAPSREHREGIQSFLDKRPKRF